MTAFSVLDKKKEIVSFFLKNGVLIDKHVLDLLEQPFVLDSMLLVVKAGLNPLEYMPLLSKDHFGFKRVVGFVRWDWAIQVLNEEQELR